MILEDCLGLLNVSRQNEDSRLKRLSQELEIVAERMVDFSARMLHPDGQIALFNDAAFRIEASPQDLFRYLMHYIIVFSFLCKLCELCVR